MPTLDFPYDLTLDEARRRAVERPDALTPRRSAAPAAGRLPMVELTVHAAPYCRFVTENPDPSQW